MRNILCIRLRRFHVELFDLLHVFQICGDRTMDVSLIHDYISKVLDNTKLVRYVSIKGVEGKLHIHQGSHISEIGGGVFHKTQYQTRLNSTIYPHSMHM